MRKLLKVRKIGPIWSNQRRAAVELGVYPPCGDGKCAEAVGGRGDRAIPSVAEEKEAKEVQEAKEVKETHERGERELRRGGGMETRDKSAVPSVFCKC